MSRKKQRWGGELCAYCGVRPGITSDHVVAQGLFPATPEFWPTVPACRPCHDEKTRHEEYLREMLVADISASKHPIAQTIFNGPVMRAAGTNRSRLAKAARADGKFEAMHTQGGIYLGHYPTVPLEAERINAAITMMVCGLYYSIRKQRIPDEYVFDVRRVPPWHASEEMRNMQQLSPGEGPRLLGDRVFGCYFRYADADEYLTLWLLWFYESVFFYVSTEPPGGEERAIKD